MSQQYGLIEENVSFRDVDQRSSRYQEARA